MSRRYLILDRDGVINEDSDLFIKSPEEWVPLPGSLEAIVRLNQAGFSVAVATNQSGIARGLFDEQTLNAMHQKLHRELNRLGGQIELIAYCPHGPDAGCECRKPKPGLLHQIARRWKIDLRGIPVIGDSQRDLEAARAVGARPILVRTGKGEQTLRTLETTVEVYADLGAAADALLKGDAA